MEVKQLCLLEKPLMAFGGNLDIDFKRTRRPLATKKPMHLVLKSKPSFHLFKHKGVIKKILLKQARSFGIKIYSLSIQKDHVHLNIRVLSRETYKAFIRAVTGLIARQLGKGIWKLRPFTRITAWGRAFKTLQDYIFQNELEIQGLIPYQRRKHRYRTRALAKQEESGGERT